MPLVKAIEHGAEQTESLIEKLRRCGVVDLVTPSFTDLKFTGT